MVHYDLCPLCSSVNLNARLICTDYFVSGEKFPVVSCGECGFTFTQDHPGENEAGKYYASEEYISHSDTSRGLTNKLYRLARSFMLKRKVQLVKRMTGKDKGTILDIGSGTGHFANAMKLEGWLSEGIEINEKARSFSRKEFQLDVYDTSEIQRLNPEKYDCITLWHVLEHFHDPDRYMQEIHRLLKPDGLCIIALPNSGSLDSEYFREHWAAWDVPRHIWHFTPLTFRRFAERTGFMLKETRALPLDVFYISILSEKYLGSKFSFIKGIIIGKIFFTRALFRKEKSSSLIYILRKNAH